MSAPAPASALGLPPDSRPATGSSFRRFGRSTSNNHHNNTTTHSQTYLSRQPSTANSYRSNRNPLSGRWFSPTSQSSNNPHFSSVGGTLPIPCAQPDQSSVISRYRQAFFGCYRDIGVDLRASSPDSLVSISDDSEGEGEAETQGTMARLRRPRTSSQASSRTPDPSQRPETQEMPRPEHSNRSSSSRPDSSSRVQAESPAPADPTPVENMTTPEITSTPENTETPSGPKQNATIRFYPHQDLQRNTRPSLQFIPVSRTLPSENSAIRVGRYSERDGVSVANPSAPSSAPIGFKSKVVSRRHCEFLFLNGQWHVKDVGSSSGTFLNHMRLSQPNMVSRLYPIKDGDIVQLGIDFRGGEEMIFRCVRMRVECNRSWQQQPNEFKYASVLCPYVPS